MVTNDFLLCLCEQRHNASRGNNWNVGRMVPCGYPQGEEQGSRARGHPQGAQGVQYHLRHAGTRKGCPYFLAFFFCADGVAGWGEPG